MMGKGEQHLEQPLMLRAPTRVNCNPQTPHSRQEAIVQRSVHLIQVHTDFSL
jgi:hypothetical protein